MAKSLDFTKPIATRSDYPIRIYEVFAEQGYLNGAYYDRDTDVWFPRQWELDGRDTLGEKNLSLWNCS